MENIKKKNPNAFKAKFHTKKIIQKDDKNEENVVYKVNFVNNKGCNCKNS